MTPHLHFSIHDERRPHPSGPIGFSVRPTPMDGVALGDGDESKCLASSNGGPPVARVVSPLDGAEFRAMTNSVSLRARITGGARPMRVTWTSDLEPRRPLFSQTVFGDGGSIPIVFRARGPHRIRLEVEDALHRRSADEVSIMITNNPPSVAIERPAVGFRVPVNDRVVLRGRSFDWEAGGALRENQLTWFVDDAAIATGHLAEILPDTLAPGLRLLRLVGNDGETTATDETTFEIVAPATNLAPRVRILSPSNGETFMPILRETGTDRFVQPLTLRGEAVDPETGPVPPDRLVWLVTGPDGTIEAGRGATLTHHLRAPGFVRVPFEIRLEASDAAGQVGFDTAIVSLDFLI